MFSFWNTIRICDGVCVCVCARARTRVLMCVFLFVLIVPGICHAITLIFKLKLDGLFFVHPSLIPMNLSHCQILPWPEIIMSNKMWTLFILISQNRIIGLAVYFQRLTASSVLLLQMLLQLVHTDRNGLSGAGAQDGHLDTNTAPELWLTALLPFQAVHKSIFSKFGVKKSIVQRKWMK